MKHKIFACLASATITVGIFMAVPTAGAETKPLTASEAAAVIGNFCAASYKEWRKNGTTTYLDNGMKKLSSEERSHVAIICYAYSKGYEDGIRSTKFA